MMQSNAFGAALEELFATRLAESHEFRAWFLSRTKFARLWPLARLLQAGQAEINGADHWWRRRRPVEGEKEGVAAQMLFVFEIERTRLRFALHVENAITADDLGAASQITGRRETADEKRDLAYMDLETVLLAPQQLILDDARALSFDRRIPYEAIVGFVPQFDLRRQAAA